MILAIDPGCTESGYVFVRDGNRIVSSGVLSNDAMLSEISAALRDLRQITAPRVAIEHFQNMGMIVGREVFDSVHWAGRFYEVCRMCRVTPQLVFRGKVKLWLCGNPRAKDANIRGALMDRFGRPGTKKAPGGTYGVKSHAWSALAVAAYAIDNPEDGK